MQPFTYFNANKKTAPIMVASPHSGRFIPDSTLNNTNLSQFDLRISEDFYMDEIAQSSIDLGLDFIKSEISRIHIDLNRDPKSLDYLLINDIKPKYDCPYTKIGIGLVPRIIGKSTKIHLKKIEKEEIEQRISQIHQPYHQIIFDNLHDLNSQFGRALLLDMHSMPARALGELDGDIIIGNRYGQSCNNEITQIVKSFFINNGMKVRLNHPFAGGYSTIYHSKKSLNIHAMQIEINRKLYFIEEEQIKSENFDEIKTLISKFFQYMIENY